MLPCRFFILRTNTLISSAVLQIKAERIATALILLEDGLGPLRREGEHSFAGGVLAPTKHAEFFRRVLADSRQGNIFLAGTRNLYLHPLAR